MALLGCDLRVNSLDLRLFLGNLARKLASSSQELFPEMIRGIGSFSVSCMASKTVQLGSHAHFDQSLV